MPNTGADVSGLITRAEAVLMRLEAWLPTPPPNVDLDNAIAYRWRRHGERGWLEAIINPQMLDLSRLTGIDQQKQRISQNTQQFVIGKPANNVLLTGARGTGKSSLIKAMLTEFAPLGLRVIEVEKTDLVDLSDITQQLAGRAERYIIFCDDLSFEAEEAGYKALKAALDGTLASPPDNVLIYATSNRRHLMPEYMSDNEKTQHHGAEVHPNEAVEEKISLSERFGLWLSFYPFDQDAYLATVTVWLDALKTDITNPDQLRREALQWALARGTRSGRTAWQFARDYAGRH